jgi:hypothetical protein
MAAHKAGFFIVGHVHDEIISEEDENDPKFTFEYLQNLMSAYLVKTVDWLKTLPLGAAVTRQKCTEGLKMPLLLYHPESESYFVGEADALEADGNLVDVSGEDDHELPPSSPEWISARSMAW